MAIFARRGGIATLKPLSHWKTCAMTNEPNSMMSFDRDRAIRSKGYSKPATLVARRRLINT
jgi:hypothetical protein